MSKKCLGCGATLQTSEPNKIGYCKSLNQDLCQRCFRLRHYNDLMIDMKDAIAPELVIEKIQEVKDACVVLVLDILNMSSVFQTGLLETIKDKPLIIVVNKVDLLPMNTNMEKVENYIIQELQNLRGLQIKDVLLTHSKDRHLKALLLETLNRLGLKKAIFVGNANVGKSSLLNRLLENTTFTASPYPSTTLDFTEIELDDMTWIDTPGIVDQGSILMHIDQEILQKVYPKKTIKPLVYQLYEDQSYFLEGLLRVDAKVKGNASIIFYLDPNLKIHRTKMSNADHYYTKHFDEFELKVETLEKHTFKGKKYDLEINGFGFISFFNVDEVDLYIPEQVHVTKREVLL